jgi:hypothetical protein
MDGHVGKTCMSCFSSRSLICCPVGWAVNVLAFGGGKMVDSVNVIW